jgi:hypothetical protein
LLNTEASRQQPGAISAAGWGCGSFLVCIRFDHESLLQKPIDDFVVSKERLEDG